MAKVCHVSLCEFRKIPPPFANRRLAILAAEGEEELQSPCRLWRHPPLAKGDLRGIFASQIPKNPSTAMRRSPSL